MTNITLITALLSTFISFSGCDFHTLSVQGGEDVTLQCKNFTTFLTHVFWFKLTDGPNASCIANMKSSDSNVNLCDGFQSAKFNMSSDSVTLKLTIKQVNSSDSGLYFCGFNSNSNSVIQSATSLIVEESIAVMHLIVGAPIPVLIGVIAVLAVKIRKLQKDIAARTSEDLGSDVQNYASLDFEEAKRRTRTPPENQPELNVVYATTRKKRGTVSQKM